MITHLQKLEVNLLIMDSDTKHFNVFVNIWKKSELRQSKTQMRTLDDSQG